MGSIYVDMVGHSSTRAFYNRYGRKSSRHRRDRTPTSPCPFHGQRSYRQSFSSRLLDVVLDDTTPQFHNGAFKLEGHALLPDRVFKYLNVDIRGCFSVHTHRNIRRAASCCQVSVPIQVSIHSQTISPPSWTVLAWIRHFESLRSDYFYPRQHALYLCD